MKSYIWPAVVSKQTVGSGLELIAPAVEGFAFVGRGGWLGFRCPCGYVASGRSMAAIGMAIDEHQEEATCPVYKAHTLRETDAEL